MEINKPDINKYREIGKGYCETEGSDHYVKMRKNSGIDSIERAIMNGNFEGFAVTNIDKYVHRFQITRNPDDLKKVVDYAQILCGLEIDKNNCKII